MAQRWTERLAMQAGRSLFDLGPIGDLSDGQLLERCATDRAEVAELAFAALVERHEALVWRVCLGILRDRHEAEDAFQATFIVLIRRARSLWVRDSLGPWLHEVAARTALRHRAATRRRLDGETRIAARLGRSPAAIQPPPTVDNDLAAALHEELSRLPPTLRAPLVLCDLAGASHAEAARSLGWPIGTLKSRQARGRRTLRDRLARRGFDALGVGPLVAMGSFGAIPSPTARDLAARIARRVVALPSLGPSPAAQQLAQETLHAMLWLKLRPAVASLILGLASGGVGLVASMTQEPPSPLAVVAPATAPSSSGSLLSVTENSDLRIKLRAQEIATHRARIELDQARLKRELAELNAVEFEEIIYPQDLATAQGEVALAEVDLVRARDRVDRSGALEKQGKGFKESVHVARLAVARAQFDLEQAQTTRDVLTKYTHEKRGKALRAEVDRARADELAKESSWKLERSREEALRPKLGRHDSPGFTPFHVGAF